MNIKEINKQMYSNAAKDEAFQEVPTALPWLPGVILKTASGDVYWRLSALVDYMANSRWPCMR